MNRIKFIFALVVAGGLAVVSILQYKDVARLRVENSTLRSQLDQLARAQSERNAAANSTSNANDLNGSRLAELLKLRGEATQLREQTNAMVALRRENDRLLAALKDGAQRKPSRKAPEDVPPEDIHPKDSWSFRGYDSPEATLESITWAVSKGDRASFAAGFVKEQQQAFAKEMEGKDFATEAKDLDDQTQEFRILDRQTVSESNMTMTVYSTEGVDGQVKHRTENLKFVKEDGQWKYFFKLFD